MQRFRQIQAWRRSTALGIELHRVTSGFTRAGHANLRTQLTRAADSIPTNIVEGCGAASKKDFARFLDVSIKSAMETEHHLIAAQGLRLISPDDSSRLIAEVIEIRKMIFGYRRKVIESLNETPQRSA